MKRALLILFLLSAGVTFGQKEIKLKKKFQGTYEGVIPEYSIQSNGELHFVSSASIAIVIGENQVQVQVGENMMIGTFEIMFKAEKYFLLDVDIEGQLANERILVYKKGKKLSRDGMFPQPVTTLKKTKRRG